MKYVTPKVQDQQGQLNNVKQTLKKFGDDVNNCILDVQTRKVKKNKENLISIEVHVENRIVVVEKQRNVSKYSRRNDAVTVELLSNCHHLPLCV